MHGYGHLKVQVEEDPLPSSLAGLLPEFSSSKTEGLLLAGKFLATWLLPRAAHSRTADFFNSRK